jgi:hypothetical protein
MDDFSGSGERNKSPLDYLTLAKTSVPPLVEEFAAEIQRQAGGSAEIRPELLRRILQTSGAQESQMRSMFLQSLQSAAAERQRNGQPPMTWNQVQEQAIAPTATRIANSVFTDPQSRNGEEYRQCRALLQRWAENLIAPTLQVGQRPNPLPAALSAQDLAQLCSILEFPTNAEGRDLVYRSRLGNPLSQEDRNRLRELRQARDQN